MGNYKEFHIAGAQMMERGRQRESREGPGKVGWGQVTTQLCVQGVSKLLPNLACLLFWYSLQATNGFYIFKWLGVKIKRKACFVT